VTGVHQVHRRRQSGQSSSNDGDAHPACSH
jgi:hypothetical protein